MLNRIINSVLIILFVLALLGAGFFLYLVLVEEHDIAKFEARFNTLTKKELIPNSIAWLTINHTSINYPVMQAKDNDYYLTHNMFGEVSKVGAPFLDAHLPKDFYSYHNVVYAHNLRSGLMFSDLNKFIDKSFFEAHRTGELITPKKTYKLTVFALSVTEENYPFLLFPADETAYLKEIKEKAVLRANIKDSNRPILSLSTCRHAGSRVRTILHCYITE